VTTWEVPVTNEEAVLLLADDHGDGAALIAISQNSGNTLRVAIERYFSGRSTCKKALLTLLVRISQRAKYFVLGHDDADQWIQQCADQECRRLRNEAERRRSAPEQASDGF